MNLFPIPNSHIYMSMILLNNRMHINTAVPAIPTLHRIAKLPFPLPLPLAKPFLEPSIRPRSSRIHPPPTPPHPRLHTPLGRPPHIRQFNRLVFLILLHTRKPTIPHRRMPPLNPAPEPAISSTTSSTPTDASSPAPAPAPAFLATVLVAPPAAAVAGGVGGGARVARGGELGEEGAHAGEGGADDAAGGLDL